MKQNRSTKTHSKSKHKEKRTKKQKTYFYQNISLNNGTNITLSSNSTLTKWSIKFFTISGEKQFGGLLGDALRELSFQISYDDMVSVINILKEKSTASHNKNFLLRIKLLHVSQYYPKTFLSQILNFNHKMMLISGYSRKHCKFLIADEINQMIKKYLSYLLYIDNNKDYYINCDNLNYFNIECRNILSTKYILNIINFEMISKYQHTYSLRICIIPKHIKYFRKFIIGITKNPQKIIKCKQNNQCIHNNCDYVGIMGKLWVADNDEYLIKRCRVGVKYVIEMIVDLKKSTLIFKKPEFKAIEICKSWRKSDKYTPGHIYKKKANSQGIQKLNIKRDMNVSYYPFVILTGE